MGIRERAIQRFRIKTIKHAEDFARRLASQAAEQAPKAKAKEETQSAAGMVEGVGQSSVPLLRENRRRAFRLVRGGVKALRRSRARKKAVKEAEAAQNIEGAAPTAPQSSVREPEPPSASEWGRGKADTPRNSVRQQRTVQEAQSKAQRVSASEVYDKRAPKTREVAARQRAELSANAPKTREAVEARGKHKATIRQRMKQKLMRNRRIQQIVNRVRASKVARGAAKVLSVALAPVKVAIAAFGVVSAIVSAALLLVVLSFLLMVGAFASSPFGILMSNEAPAADAVPISAAVALINYDFNAYLERLQSAEEYDAVIMHGSEVDWPEVLAVFAVKATEAVDVVTMDADRVQRLRGVYWDMIDVTTEVQEIDAPAPEADEDPEPDDSEPIAKKYLHITLTPKTAAAMAEEYRFRDSQREALIELLAQRSLLLALIGDLSRISAEAHDVLQALPDDLSPERRAIVETACSLVGKVTYFWGGKSLMQGWDKRWGSLQLVWAEGSPTTGTYRPYGLDCSGFVDWVFYNATGGAYYPGRGGGATMQHEVCTDISWEEAIPGDLVFYPGNSHVGIVGGRDADGNLVIIHCASSRNGTVVTGAEGFTAVARPEYYGE